MKRIALSLSLFLALTLPVFAAGDAAKGERGFNRCRSCHMIASADETFVKGGRTGPNLYGVVGRQAGSVEGYDYSKSMVAAGAAGLVWTKADIATFVTDPKGFLMDRLEGPARTKMSFRLRKGGADVAAYLAGFSDESPDAQN